MLKRILKAFADWFASSAGVWQTVFLMTVLCIVEAIFPHMDEHGFWLLYWATVYSAVTQPALAFVGAQAGKRTDKILNEELQLIREELTVLREVAEAVGVNDGSPKQH